MTVDETAMYWARLRSGGPQRVPAGTAAPTGMRRLVEADAAGVWLVAELPEGARPTVLDELGLGAVAVAHPNETARVLASCLCCCWVEPGGALWPSVATTRDRVLAVFREITDYRDDATSAGAVLAALRRLAAAGWLLLDEASGTVRLGPRVAGWTEPELSTLRELMRAMPSCDQPVGAVAYPEKPGSAMAVVGPEEPASAGEVAG